MKCVGLESRLKTSKNKKAIKFLGNDLDFQKGRLNYMINFQHITEIHITQVMAMLYQP